MQLKMVPRDLQFSDGMRVVHDIRKQDSSLRYIEFKVLEMQFGAQYQETLLQQEVCIVVLTGTIAVTQAENQYTEIGQRTSVFDKRPTDSVYIGSNREYAVTSISDNVRIALCYAFSDQNLPNRVIRADENGVEERGKLNNRRLVHNILPDTVDYAQSLLVVEVFTEGGNFSSYPPHKHDQDNLPTESLLEEVYYHELYPKQGFVFQRVYTEDRSIDQTMSVENQEVVLVPRGHHPVGVPDGYTSYYLNVMAGPTRIWKFHNDKDHEWILSR
ncbi:5-deoxy-glucuronate isomerase (plasmid) [Entomospira entomophila]|uniref:5-deoxy-glucuronate isomerase n=1 Tax=Entomospira entomophila TaxID=2719988 RepID=A0A968G9W5_9SPIO|nr:5-deoxy-glucuronate isomerase [Entomospira entomophilus]NIZ41283.1 5-deoxy-glucuronate isomerase [Entomospira entomophilus]WDI36190.1 5-deoxy-glucuronate isomerase [Entomospira entomophilus]